MTVKTGFIIIISSLIKQRCPFFNLTVEQKWTPDYSGLRTT